MDNVILSVDSVYPPLTGIGKYTSFLARGLADARGFESSRYFDNGRWIEQRALLDRIDRIEAQPLSRTSISSFSKLKKHAARSKTIMAAYSKIAPLVFSRILSKYSKSHLYHSTNFIAPSFPGKKVTTFHDLSIIKYPQFHPEARVRYLKDVMQRSINVSDIIIVDSNTVRGEILEYYRISADRIRCVPLAATLQHAAVLPPSNTFLVDRGIGGKKYILSVSTIEPRKNLKTVISAYKALSKDLKSEYPLVVAGDIGWKSQEIHTTFKQGETANIIYLGYVSDSQLVELFKNASLFVSASLYEGFGLPCLEAQFLEVPALVSDIPVHREVTGGMAKFFPPTEEGELTEMITRTLSNSMDLEILVRQAKAHADNYSWDKTVSHTLGIYKEL